MTFYPGFGPVKYRSYRKGRLHDAKWFFYLPEGVIGFKNIFCSKILFTSLDSIISIKYLILFNRFIIKDPVDIPGAFQIFLFPSFVTGSNIGFIVKQGSGFFNQPLHPVCSVFFCPLRRMGDNKVFWEFVYLLIFFNFVYIVYDLVTDFCPSPGNHLWISLL